MSRKHLQEKGGGRTAQSILKIRDFWLTLPHCKPKRLLLSPSTAEPDIPHPTEATRLLKSQHAAPTPTPAGKGRIVSRLHFEPKLQFHTRQNANKWGVKTLCSRQPAQSMEGAETPKPQTSPPRGNAGGSGAWRFGILCKQKIKRPSEKLR